MTKPHRSKTAGAGKKHMSPNKPKPPKQQLFSKASFSKPLLIAFSLIFAAIGGYAIYRSFAAVSLGSSLPIRMPQSSGAGGTFYVSPTGSDSATGSQAAPWQTINHALATVPLTGSIIKVQPGTYSSSGGNYVIQFSRLGNTNDPITLQATTPGTVTIAADTPTDTTIGAWIVTATGLRIQGLTFSLPGLHSNQAAYEQIQVDRSSRIEITGCTFNETAGQGIAVEGGSSDGQTSNDVWIIGNTFRPAGSNPYAQVTGTGFTSDQYYGSMGSHWIYSGIVPNNAAINSGDRRLVIANNVFTGSTAGADIEQGPESQNSYIVNNTFFGNHATTLIQQAPSYPSSKYSGNGIWPYSINGSPYNNANSIYTNNIFDDLDGHAVMSGSATPGSNNLVQNNLSFNLRNNSGVNGDQNKDYEPLYEPQSPPTFSTGTGNLADADPMFNNPGSYDYTLKAGSPVIGKSDPAYTPPTDITGAARSGTSPSLGAYEAAGSTSGGSTTTFGNNIIGASIDTATDGFKVVANYTAPQAGSIARISGYISGLGAASGSQAIRAVIYADSGGSPGAFLGMSNQVTVTAGQAFSWVDFNFPTPLAVSAGSIWMGYFAGTTSDLTQLAYTSSTGAARGNLNPGGYSAAPTNPFGSPQTADFNYSLYATYSSSSSGSNIGDLNSDGIVDLSDLTILLFNYHTTNATADINGDGQVTILDASVLFSHYGQTVASAPTMPVFSAPAFTPIRTLTATSSSDFLTKIANLQAGDLLNVPAMTISGEVAISRNLASAAEVHFASGVKFTGDAVGSLLPAVWVHDTQNVRFYGGDVTGAGNDGIRFDDDTNVLWWDFVVHDTAGTGVHVRGISHTASGIDLRGTIYNCGLAVDPTSPDYNLAVDPHGQKGTGVHGINIGTGTGQLVTNSRFVITVHDQRYGSAFEIQGTQNSTIYLDARNITGDVYSTSAPWQPAPYIQVAGSALQPWGDNTQNLDVKYLYADNVTRAFEIDAGLNSTNSGITLDYARVINARMSPVYPADPAITYMDVQ